MINPNESCLKLERDNFTYWTERIVADEASGLWGYNTESCMKYGRPCEFLEICKNGYSLPEDAELVMSYYRRQCPRILTEGRCTHDLNHGGECKVEEQQQAADFTVETDEIEEAVA